MDAQGYQAKQRCKPVLAVYLILKRLEDGKILLAKRQNTGYMDGKWELPAGHLEEGELPTEALFREIREELGIELFPDLVWLVHTSFRPPHDKTGSRIDLFFLAREWDGEVRICEPDKCSKHKWFSVFECLQLEDMILHNQHALDCIQKHTPIPFSELSVEWLKERGLYEL